MPQLFGLVRINNWREKIIADGNPSLTRYPKSSLEKSNVADRFHIL